MKNNIFDVLLISVLLIGCSSDDDVLPPANGNPQDGDKGWLIPIVEVKDGGPGKDGIPSIDSPHFVFANDTRAAYLKEDDLVIGLVMGDVVKAYPHPILDWHEIVNDKVGGENITISYCPLTGTGFGWKGKVEGVSTTFGVSGLLYNANLILYDRKTDSNWSQLGLQCVNGKQIGAVPELFRVVETTWSVWKSIYPNTQVMTLNTGFERSYGQYPYGFYKTKDNFLIFTVSPINNTLPNKERVLVLIDDEISKVYRFSKFGNGMAIKQKVSSRNYLVVGTSDFLVGYELTGDLINLTYTYDFNLGSDVTTIFFDNEGNKWSIYGEAISGPRKGQRLKTSKSVIGYWFAIAAFYPDPKIY